MSSLRLSELFSFGWAMGNARLVECYRHYFSETVTVITKSGPVKGHKIVSSFDYEYINFLGIPYAKPPIGELRFKDPQPIEPSTEIINSKFNRSGSVACQTDLVLRKTIGSEDCLHLSVFTRDIKPEKLKPVMVWIHGGAFMLGSNSKDFYNPEFLLRNDVVIISINYRLGALGFLSFHDRELGIAGNAGLKDQVLALKWIKENCENFGGDPNNITIFGESAGGASVHFHMVSEMSRDLFHKAIAMSGNVYSPWAVSPIKDWTHRIGRKLGWNGDGGDKACFDILQKSSNDSIVKAQEAIITLEDRIRYVLFPFGPVVEPYESTQCFLSKDPKELANSAWSKNMPMIIGGCSDEGLLLYKLTMKKPNILRKLNLSYALPLFELGLHIDDNRCKEMGESLKKFYFGYSPISVETIFVYLMVVADKYFVHPTHRTLMSRRHTQSAPTYLYRFNFDSSSFSVIKKIFAGKSVPGACHADDCSYIFKNILVTGVPAQNTDEWKTIERMCACWTSFARTGNPNNDIIAPVQWEPVAFDSKSNELENIYKCLNIANEVSYVDLPEYDRMQYWDEMYKSCNHPLV